MKATKSMRLVSVLLIICLLVGAFPVMTARAAEITGGGFYPREGSLELEFGYQRTQYININVYVTSFSNESVSVLAGSIVSGYLLTGAEELAPTLTETVPSAYTPTTVIDPGASLTELGLYETDKNFAGGSIPLTEMMKHKLVWDGTLNGIPIIGPNLDEDMFIMTIEIEPLGRPDRNKQPWVESPGTPEEVPHPGEDYTWTTPYKISTDILVDYRNFIEGSSDEPTFLMLKGGLSDQLRKELYEVFLSGGQLCDYLSTHPEISDLVLDAQNLDPVDMVTGSYQFMYTDLRMEGTIPLSFIRAYHSRYKGGSLGRGFTHSYEYSLRDDRGIIRVTMPGGEEQVFLKLDDTHAEDYKSLQDSDFTMHDVLGGGFQMRHKDGAKFDFTSEGVLMQIRNPDGTLVADLTYDDGGNLSSVKGVAGSFVLTWDSGHISKVTDSAGRTVTYGYTGDNLTSVTNADGDTLIYKYDGNGYLNEATDFEGVSYIWNTYDGVGRVTEQQFLQANKLLTATIRYDDANFVTTCVDFSGRETRYYYDNHRNILSIEDADGSTSNGYNSNYTADKLTDNQGNAISYSMDPFGNVTGITTPDGPTSITYDGNGRITSITDAENGIEKFTYTGASLETYTDKNNNVTRYEYGILGLPVKITDALNGETSYSYDSNGRLLSVTDAEGGVTTFGYDAVGRISVVIDPLNGRTEYEYSPAGKLLSIKDALGSITEFEYNKNGFTSRTTDAEGGVRSTVYGANGQAMSSTDANGNVTTYSYNSEGLLETVTDPEGNSTTYIYDDKARLTHTEDAAGNLTTYEYDSLDRLEKIRDALGGETVYTYDAMGRTKTVEDAKGNITVYTYDKLGRTVKVTDALSGETAYSYDPNGNLLTVTDANGNITGSTYDALNRVATTTDAENNATTYDYDRVGRLLSVENALHGVTSYSYDLAGNMLSATDPEGNKTQYVYDALGRVTNQINADNSSRSTVYDALGRVIKSYDELNNETSYSYDLGGNLLETIDPRGFATAYTYNRNNQLTGITYPDGGIASYAYTALGQTDTYTDPMGNVTAYTYDALGRRKTVTDAESIVTEYFYDAVGNTTMVTRDGKIVSRSEYDELNRQIKAYDALGNSALYDYDAVGSLLTYTDREGNATRYTYNNNYQLTKTTDALGYIQETAYDALGRPTESKDKNGGVTAYEYDKNGNVLKVTDAENGVTAYSYSNMNRMLSSTDALGKVTSYEYDLAGRLLKTTDPMNGSTSYEYDANGNLTRYTNRNNEWVRYDYDSMNRQTKETNQINLSKEYEYDKNGNVSVYTDGNKNRTEYVYDGQNRLESETNAIGGVTEYAYDYLGNLAAYTTDGGGGTRSTTSYEYDFAGNLTKEVSPLGNTTVYTYDKEGNVLTKTDENGVVTSFEYDALYRLTTRTDADDTASFEYDKLSNILTATNNAGTVVFAYDALSRTTNVTNEDGTQTAYVYDAKGNRLSVTYPDGLLVSYVYDANGNVTQMTDHDGTGISYTRDAEGRVTKESFTDGSTTEYAYNTAGQLTTLTEVTSSNSTRRKISYVYDDNGNLKNELRSGVDIDKRDESVFYYYDAVNQLVRTVIDGKATTYTYDLAGNMLSDGTATYTYDTQNRLLTKTDAGGTTNYTYDNAGNLIKETSPSGTTTYSYDAQNRLVLGARSDGQSSTYTYNALGVRTKNVQVRENVNAGYRNADLVDGSHGTDYLDYLSDDRATWQPAWETEVGTTVQNNFETVTKAYVVDYLSLAYRDILVTEDGGFTQRYVYDASGTRISAEYGYADGTERGAKNADGEYGENLRSDIAVQKVGKVWFRTSMLGSTLFVVDANGETVSHTIYDAWGKPLTETYTDANYSGLDNANNFTGYTYDEVLNLYYAQNRFYDAATHRFTQEDIVKDGGNWYVYCGNNPGTNIDPWGLFIDFEPIDFGNYDQLLADLDSMLTTVTAAKNHAVAFNQAMTPVGEAGREAQVTAASIKSGMESVSASASAAQVHATNAINAGKSVETFPTLDIPTEYFAESACDSYKGSTWAKVKKFFAPFEVTIGVGMGLEGKGEILGTGANAGFHTNFIEFKLSDSQVTWQKSANAGIGVDFFGYGIGPSITTEYDLYGNQLNEESWVFADPDILQSLTLVDFSFYALIGVEISIKLNF